MLKPPFHLVLLVPLSADRLIPFPSGIRRKNQPTKYEVKDFTGRNHEYYFTGFRYKEDASAAHDYRPAGILHGKPGAVLRRSYYPPEALTYDD